MIKNEKDFCVAPWVSMAIRADGDIGICCRYRLSNQFGNTKRLNVYTSSISEIWNSDVYKKFRKLTVKGGRLPECKICFQYTDADQRGYREFIAKRHLDDVLSVLQRGIDSDYELSGGPTFLTLSIGNRCTLKCRMCNASFSDKIAMDPVRESFDGKRYNHFSDTDVFTIDAAEKVQPDIDNELIHDVKNSQYILTKKSDISMPVPNGVDVLVVDLCTKNKDFFVNECLIEVNGGVCNAVKTESGVSVRLAAPARQRLVLSLKPPAGANVSITKIKVEYRGGVFPSRLATDRPWYDNGKFLAEELFTKNYAIKEINIMGGEVFVNPAFDDILDLLIEQEMEETVLLSFSTNLSIIKKNTYEKLKRFRRLKLTVSIDGDAKYNNYIRYPSNWDVLCRNLQRLKDLNLDVIYSNTCVQAYNILNIHKVIPFLDEWSLSPYFHLIRDPAFLSVSNLNEEIVREGAKRIRSEAQHVSVGYIRRYYEGFCDTLERFTEFSNDPDQVQHLVRYTKTLDAAYGFNTLEYQSELFEMLGVSWDLEGLEDVHPQALKSAE